jgi:hypothetical protein
MTTTASYITDTAVFQPFYYLKITGLPYYFFATVDPTSASFGAAAWSLPAGYSAVRGMQVPTATLEQAAQDIIGGIATPERLRVEMVDFNVTDANGAHSFFGRLLAPGRISSPSSVSFGTLAADLPASATVGATFSVLAPSGFGFAVADTYIGGETIGISAVSGPAAGPDGPTYTLTIAARNKFPCMAAYPPAGFYRVPHDATGALLPAGAVVVTQEPLTFVGRTAALYIGHMKPDGTPEPEANALCRCLGRIRSVDYGQTPATYEFTIEGITGDLDKAQVAPGLAHAEIAPGFYLQSEHWRTFVFGVSVKDNPTATAEVTSLSVTIDNGAGNIYPDAQSLIDQINGTLRANAATFTGTLFATLVARLSVHLTGTGSDVRAVFGLDPPDAIKEWQFFLSYPGFANIVNHSQSDGLRAAGLLAALGWPVDTPWIQMSADTNTDPNANAHVSLLSPQPMPTTFVPTYALDPSGIDVDLSAGTDANGDRFFTDQGDQSAVLGLGIPAAAAWVRLGNGVTMQLTAHSATSLTLNRVVFIGDNRINLPFYVTPGELASVDQILVIPGRYDGTGEKAFARLLCSTTATATDGEYNIFPEGVGLGMNGIIDKTAWRRYGPLFDPGYLFEVDSSTKFGDIFIPKAKEIGLVIVWDPASTLVTLRPITFTGSAGASTFQFDETNRIKPDDRSTANIDTSGIRTGWVFQYGWDAMQKKTIAPDIVIQDDWAIAAYQVASRSETIKDITIPAYNTQLAAAISGKMVGARGPYVQYPWLKVTRSVNKRGLLLAPGSYHKIIDATIVNPFTGLMGISSSDNVYGWLMKVQAKLDDGTVRATFLINQITNDARPWAPTGLVDFAAASNGYNNGTGVLTMAQWFTSARGVLIYDGADFQVGDNVILKTWDNDGAPAYARTTTISAISADGRNVTVAAGLGALSSTVETIMVLQKYTSATADRQTGTHKVAFQGDGDALLIQSTVRNHRWS